MAEKQDISTPVMSWTEWNKMKELLNGLFVGGTAFISEKEMKEKNLNKNNFL